MARRDRCADGRSIAAGNHDLFHFVPMSNNQEIIEARLAAYVDNELDPSERVEIENHLAQNPQYRGLIEELRGGRDILRGLPREAAPAEFAEAFNSILERNALSAPPVTSKMFRGGASARGRGFWQWRRSCC